jgi:hypothetical protein
MNLTKSQFLDLITVKQKLKLEVITFSLSLKTRNQENFHKISNDQPYLIQAFDYKSKLIVIMNDNKDSPFYDIKYHKTLTNCFEDIANAAHKGLILLHKAQENNKIIWIHDDRINGSDVFLVTMKTVIKNGENVYTNPIWRNIK